MSKRIALQGSEFIELKEFKNMVSISYASSDKPLQEIFIHKDKLQILASEFIKIAATKEPLNSRDKKLIAKAK